MSTPMPNDEVAAAFRQAYQSVIDRTGLPSDQVPVYAVGPAPNGPRYRWAVVAGAVALISLVFAVIVQRGGDVPPADSEVLAGFRAHQTASSGGMDAIVVGTVEVDRDTGCVWLADEGGSRYPVVWPLGTVAELDPLRIVAANGMVILPGDGLEGSGGYVPAANATDAAGLEPFPPTCLTTGDAAVFNADSKLATPVTTTTVATTTTTTTPELTFPPARENLEHGELTWAVILAGAADPEDPVMVAAEQAAADAGYAVGWTGCDEGAAEALGLPDGTLTISAYFDTNGLAEQAAEAFQARGVDATVAEVRTFCLD